MDVEQLKQDVRDGRMNLDRLVDVIAMLQRQLAAANQEIEELKKQLGERPTEKIDQPFSMKAEDQRQEARGRKGKKTNQSHAARDESPPPTS